MSESQVPEEVVESTLLAIASDPVSREVILSFRLQQHRFELHATGVDDLLVDRFFNQNIVDEVKVFDADSDVTGVRDLLAAVLFHRDNAAEVVEPSLVTKLDDCTTAVLDGSRVLLEIIPVYGASLLLLAASIKWTDSDATDQNRASAKGGGS